MTTPPYLGSDPSGVEPRFRPRCDSNLENVSFASSVRHCHSNCCRYLVDEEKKEIGSIGVCSQQSPKFGTSRREATESRRHLLEGGNNTSLQTAGRRGGQRRRQLRDVMRKELDTKRTKYVIHCIDCPAAKDACASCHCKTAVFSHALHNKPLQTQTVEGSRWHAHSKRGA